MAARFRFRPPTALQRAVAGTNVSSLGAQLGGCGDVVLSRFITPGVGTAVRNYVWKKNRPGFRNLVNGVDPVFCGPFGNCSK